MFANSFQSGFISVFYSVGTNPLSLWDKSVKNGHIQRIVDDEVKLPVLELSGSNVTTTYITCPIKEKASLGIKLPFLVMVVKNMKKYFTFEIQIADNKEKHRRFRVTNSQSTTIVRPACATIPIELSPGWNHIQFNLAHFTKRVYGTTYMETVRVQIHANTRIRRIYFSDRLYAKDEIPQEYRLFLPSSGSQKKQDKKSKETAKPPIRETESPPPKFAQRKNIKVEKIEMRKEISTVTPPKTLVAESVVKSLSPKKTLAAEETSVADEEKVAVKEEKQRAEATVVQVEETPGEECGEKEEEERVAEEGEECGENEDEVYFEECEMPVTEEMPTATEESETTQN